MSEIQNLVGYAIQKIQEVKNVYQRFSRKTQWIGMSKMLHSMLDMEKEHEKVLLALHQRGNLGELFSAASGPCSLPGDFFQEIHFVDNMNFIDFLSMVILQQEEFAKLFTNLAACTGDGEIGHLFTSLSEDARKQRLWALDRYELEILTL